MRCTKRSEMLPMYTELPIYYHSEGILAAAFETSKGLYFANLSLSVLRPTAI